MRVRAALGTEPAPELRRLRNLIASTTTPLHCNPSCTVRPMFDAGTLKFVATRNSLTTNVTIQFTACGQHTVTRS